MSAIHDDVKQELNDLQGEAKDLEKVAGHELIRLYNALRSARRAIQAAKIGQDIDPGEIRAGEGAIEDPLHPGTAATEAITPTGEQIAAKAAREPDAAVRDKIIVDAAESQDAPIEPAVAASAAEAESKSKRGSRKAS